MLHIILDSAIHVTRFDKNAYPDLALQLRRDLVIENPERAKLKRLGRSGWSVPEELHFYRYDRVLNELTLPRGYWSRLHGHLHRLNIDHEVDDRRVVHLPVSFHSQIVLRDYQVPAIEALLREEQGILEAPCGAGKTQIGLELIARLSQPALWLTHTLDLANQVFQRVTEYLDIPAQEIGFIGAGCRRLGDRLTIGLVQTMTDIDDPELLSSFGVVILDECHHSPAATWAAVLDKLPARYRYGVTATLQRGDGLEVAAHLYLGPTLYEITPAAVQGAGGTVIPKLITVKYAGRSRVWDEHVRAVEEYKAGRLRREPRLDYHRLLTELLRNEERNHMILQTIAWNARNHVTLVLSERIEHCLLLRDRLIAMCPGIRAAVIHGQQQREVREHILTDAREGRLDVLFAVDIAKEGLDVPRLDRLHLVAGGRNEAELRQKVGRIMRPAPGKTDAVVFDYVDENVGVLMNQYYARRRVYRELGILPTRMERKAG